LTKIKKLKIENDNKLVKLGIWSNYLYQINVCKCILKLCIKFDVGHIYMYNLYICSTEKLNLYVNRKEKCSNAHNISFTIYFFLIENKYSSPKKGLNRVYKCFMSFLGWWWLLQQIR